MQVLACMHADKNNYFRLVIVVGHQIKNEVMWFSDD